MNEPVTVVAVLASHNRRERTLECLRSLFSQELDAGVELSAVLVDDGSTDGTAGSVRRIFPEITVLDADGQRYWARAMALAEREALRRSPDYVLWLNDDVVLDPYALATMLGLSLDEGGSAVVAGALRDPRDGTVTYSGVRRRDWHPLRMELVEPRDEPVLVEAFNGNVVLVPAGVARALGGIDDGFVHALADFDYGLRAAQLGYASILAPATVGICTRDAGQQAWLDAARPVRERVGLLLGPKGIHAGSTARYLRRHGGRAWPVFWAASYVKAAALMAAASARRRGAQRPDHPARIPGGNDSGRNRPGDEAACADHGA